MNITVKYFKYNMTKTEDDKIVEQILKDSRESRNKFYKEFRESIDKGKETSKRLAEVRARKAERDKLKAKKSKSITTSKRTL